MALVHASKLLDSLILDNIDEQTGVKIFKEAIKSPFIDIIANSGKAPGYYLDKVLHSDDYTYGYNVKNDRMGSMVEMGVVDSFQNLQSYLNDAVSIGSCLLTTECIIGNKKYYQPTDLSAYPKFSQD